ncbi:MAG: HDIG domain-containing protein [Candidatus Fermentibacteria bacterium]|nr:HDIG domain-containing protein [Candidatus Fermentibacteria bacterium]
MKIRNRSIPLNLMAAVLFMAILIIGFYFGFDSRGALSDRNLVIGEPVAEGIIAVHDFSVPYSSSEFEEIAGEVEASIPVYLVRNQQTGTNSSEEIQSLIFVATENNELARYFGQRVSSLYETGIIDIEALRTTYHGSHAITENGSAESISELFTLTEARDGIRLDLERRGVLREKIPMILALIIPDLEIDPQGREAAVLEQLADLSSIKREFRTGEEILPPGGLFTEEISHYWNAMVLSPVGGQGVVEHIIAKTGLAAVLLLLGVLFLWKEQRAFSFSVSDLALIFAIWGLTMGLTILLFRSGVRELSMFSFTMFGASLTSVFFDNRLRKRTINYSWFLAAVFSSIFAIASPYPMSTFLMGFIPACLVARAIKDLSDTGTSIALVLGILSSVIIFWFLATAGSSSNVKFGFVVWIALIGLPVVITGTVKVISHPFELLFHVATARTYERLSNDNHPLRELLRREARGTYVHSILVGDLASSAAAELGADEELAKLGGVFHDIGKMVEPEMFIENISNPDENNPHISLSPAESAKIIIAHVGNGIDLAVKNKLPSDIRSIIEQHHGDTCVRYFLEKAKRELPPGGDLDETVFHYNGPKPQSVEAALVMLADAASSAVKGLGNKASYEEKAAVVSRIIREKADEGQFDQCKLTRSMRTRVAHVFMEVLSQSDYERIKDFPHGQ